MTFTEGEFKNTFTFRQRQNESSGILKKYPDRIPVIVETRKGLGLELDKHKYLVPSDMTIGQFIYVIRKRMSVPATMGVYVFFGGQMVQTAGLMSSTYKNVMDEDGFMYGLVATENTFGGCLGKTQTGGPCSAPNVKENTVKRGTREFMDSRYCQMHQPDREPRKKCKCPQCHYHRGQDRAAAKRVMGKNAGQDIKPGRPKKDRVLGEESANAVSKSFDSSKKPHVMKSLFVPDSDLAIVKVSGHLKSKDG